MNCGGGCEEGTSYSCVALVVVPWTQSLDLLDFLWTCNIIIIIIVITRVEWVDNEVECLNDKRRRPITIIVRVVV